MSARDVWNQGMDDVRLWLVTPEPRPLAVSGPGASDAVGELLAGAPADADGFMRTDAHGRVPGLYDVYAAGDGADFPIKQGGLATQQADAVAESVAARMGAPVTPEPFKPVLRGRLFTGGPQQFLRAGIAGGEGEGSASPQALWWPPTKVAGAYLAQYLFDRDEAEALGRPPAGFTHVEVPVGEAHGIELLGARRPHSDAC
jgi:sulfide:quinone oxidoreductase